MEAFDDSIGSTAESAQLESTPNESAQLESTPNESGNASKASDGLSQADILELLQNNAPSGYKYCLTLVPRETDTLEKVLKNRVVSTKKVNPTTGGESYKPTRRKFSMHGAVITTAEYKTKIAEAQKKPEAKAKNKRKNTQVTQKKPQKKQRKSLKQRLREMKKSAVYESDSEADDDQDDTACPNNNEEERNTAPQANNNEREESSSIPTVTNANQPKAIINENTLPSILLELDDHNIGKCFAIYWPKPKAYYWGKLIHVFILK